ncbi:MAG: hypothetical protein Q8R18_03490 [bacterium]|nr:hypothetical protein [bacterium]
MYNPNLDEAKKAFSKAEGIIEKSYAFTGELKLLPLALQQLQKATKYAWEFQGEKKPKLLIDLEKINQNRKDSPLEFKRKEKLVICTKDYKTTIIDEKIIRKYLQKTKSYLQKCKKKTQHEKN